MASSNCFMNTLTTADPSNNRIRGLLNWKRKKKTFIKKW